MIHLANFLAGTSYRPKKFKQTGRDGLGEIRYFFQQAKKYTVMTTCDKHDLEEKTPLDFVEYIINSVNIKLPIKVSSVMNNILDRGNARQVFDFILANDEQEQINTYINVCKRIKSCELPVPSNRLLAHFILQSLVSCLESSRDIMMIYLKSKNIECKKYAKKFSKTIKYVTKHYKDVMKDENQEISYYIKTLPDICIETDIFLFPKRTFETIKEYGTGLVPMDITEYRDIITNLFVNGTVPLSSETKTFYNQNFDNLFNMNVVKYKNDLANMNTLRNMTSLMYSEDVSALKNLPLDQDCSRVKKYKKYYEEILDYLSKL